MLLLLYVNSFNCERKAKSNWKVEIYGFLCLLRLWRALVDWKLSWWMARTCACFYRFLLISRPEIGHRSASTMCAMRKSSVGSILVMEFSNLLALFPCNDHHLNPILSEEAIKNRLEEFCVYFFDGVAIVYKWTRVNEQDEKKEKNRSSC